LRIRTGCPLERESRVLTAASISTLTFAIFDDRAALQIHQPRQPDRASPDSVMCISF
jgi:hypothetical protein